jgi:hypothetical protein
VKAHGLYPITTGLGSDAFYLNVADERCPLRGGGWYYSALAGVFYLDCYSARSVTYDTVGGRLALIL